MNVAIVFGGGVGSRFSAAGTPKQFVELYGKPIIIYAIEQFDQNPLIDEIVIPCIEGWQSFLRHSLIRFQIQKPCHVIPGGTTSHQSRSGAMRFISENLVQAEIVVLHDAVRPLVSQKDITEVVTAAKEHGGAVTFVNAIETPAITSDFSQLGSVCERAGHVMVRAPQAFRFAEAFEAHVSRSDLPEFTQIDSCTLMAFLGHKMRMVETSYDNIKITTPKDFFLLKALIDERQIEQVFGIK